MRLDLSSTTLEKTAEFQTNEFGIGNDVVLMKIVREKIYSNPAKTVCQEIMSNARDAHREVGKDSVPIEVILPNEYEPYYTVRDFGPGINPKRMKEVYLLYGNSTKRSDDSQTGGFGLGAKTPFALVDNFSIVTTTPEEIYIENGVTYHNCLVKRNYIAVLNESGRGEVNLISQEKSEGPQGTDIVIPIEHHKFHDFNEYTEEVGRYWGVRPIVRGRSDFKFEDYTYDVQGEDWKLSFKTDYTITAVLDGIPYKVNTKNLKVDFDLIKRYTTVLYFKCGELKVIANREDLDYNPKTIQMLSEKLLKIKEVFIKSLQDKVGACSTLWDAHVKLNELNDQGLEEAKWGNFNLKSGSLKVSCAVYEVRKRSYDKKFNVCIEGTINFNSPILIDDSKIEEGQNLGTEFINLKKKKKIKKFFEQNNCSMAQVISFDPAFWTIDIKDDKGNVAKGNCFSEIKELGIDTFPMVKLSSIELEKQERSPRGERKANLKRFNVDGYRKWNLWWSDYKISKELISTTLDRHVYVKIGKRQAFFNGAEIDLYTLKDIVNSFGIKSLYGVTDKDLNKVQSNSSWVLLDDVIKKDIKDNNIMDYDKSLIDPKTELGTYAYKTCMEILERIEDKNSIAYTFLSVKPDRQLNAKYNLVRSLIPKTVNSSTSTIVEDFNKKYPFIEMINDYDSVQDEILWYINAKNKENVLTINDCVV